MKRFFIVGSQGIPANYGGLETFAEEVSTRLAKQNTEVYVTCERVNGEEKGPSTYKGVHLLYVVAPTSNLRTIVADTRALYRCQEIAQPGDVIYLLGYGVGPFASRAIEAIKAKGVHFWVNPDGLEWRRPRWSWLARQYLEYSERYLLSQADKVICDAEAIKTHHAARYGIEESRMEVIEYGAPLVTEASQAAQDKQKAFLADHGLERGEYYTYVGRFVPDNNLELMVRGVLDDQVDRKLLILAAHDKKDPFYLKLKRMVKNAGQEDKIVFSGGVYDQPLLRALRLDEFAYFHGHEVGGTNPSLVEAMGLGSFILALATPFNKEVLGSSALFYNKNVDDFVRLLHRVEALTTKERSRLRQKAQYRVENYYNWKRITEAYADLLGQSTAVPQAA